MSYGNYILTKNQIDDLVSDGLVFGGLAKNTVDNPFRRLDNMINPAPGPTDFGSTLASSTSDVGGLWARVLIHFNNYLRGESGTVNFVNFLSNINDIDGISGDLEYDGSLYSSVKELEIYEPGDPPVLRSPASKTLRDRGELILRTYKVKWNELRNNSINASPPNPVLSLDFNSGFNIFNAGAASSQRAIDLYNRKYTPPLVHTDRKFFSTEINSNIAQFVGSGRPNPAFTYFLLSEQDNTAEPYIYAVWARLTALHTSLYGHYVGDGLGMVPFIAPGDNLSTRLLLPSGDPWTAAKLFINVVRGVEKLADQNFVEEQEELANTYAVDVVLPEQIEEAAEYGFTPINLPTEVKEQVISNSNNSANRFFSNTFNSELIAMVPLIYNFYLTSEYFSGIDEAFQNPKDRVLDIILSTIANDNNFDSTPDLRRPAANAAVASATGQDQQAAFNSAARDFILKMLIKTPIDILKGLVELIDPHVAISKVIKTGTGFAFNELAGALDQGIQSTNLNQTITDVTNNAVEPNLNGDDLLTLILCAVDAAMKEGAEAANAAPTPAPPIPENFFPRVSIDGIDFTGTVSGMLMMPPSPLGLIYLLLELLKNDVTNLTENVSNANTESANEVECTLEPQNLLPESCDDTE